MQPLTSTIRSKGFEAVLFDLDGVLTATTKAHARSWKMVFDEVLAQGENKDSIRPFDIVEDYRLHVDGRSRYDGVRDFLRSRGIRPARGVAEDPPGLETICAIGNRKNVLVNELFASEGVEAYEGSVALVRELRAASIRLAVVSSSHNCAMLLDATRMTELFDARIDGNTIDRLGLPGKPAPDAFLEAARRLGTRPDRAVVIEDAIAGVQAGRVGGFGLVIGVDRGAGAERLRNGGADMVVGDLGALLSP